MRHSDNNDIGPKQWRNTGMAIIRIWNVNTRCVFLEKPDDGSPMGSPTLPRLYREVHERNIAWLGKAAFRQKAR
jgi:hypothetical protein